ncbi:hypothetical protein [Nostoc sp. KVJ20]|uniref:hypothetical protein n=1 Tax=Nostoc sp. KVJ20 TaxID=457944 RepID=UPI00114CD42A|nr:hypothetical protein [Nostoc sp. KVJ20]
MESVLNDFCLEVLEDGSFVAKAFKQIHQLKREFGKGYALINIGEFHPDIGEFIIPRKDKLETLWLDETSTHEYLNSEVAATVLNVVDYESCPDKHEVFIFMASIDNGDTVKVGRYSIFAKGGYVPDPYRLKPSSITSKQIEKRLRRMANSGVRLLILDTSNPDFMGKNLAKWLREIKRLGKNASQHFSVMIDATDEFPAELPPDLQDDCWTIRVGN